MSTNFTPVILRPEQPGGVLTAEEARRTADAIVAMQRPSGEIPWYDQGHTDPWDLVEAAMGLDTQGRHDRAAAAYHWLRSHQRPDGSWAREYRHGVATDTATESNFNTYLAVGLWHHHLSAPDSTTLRVFWPTVVAAMDHALDMQRPDGAVVWARGADGTAADEALLTGCCSIDLSIRCALAIAAELGEPRPDWELAASRLRHALVVHPESFSPRSRYSMDWYYPVLTGILTGEAAQERLTRDWDRFVVPGLGIHCVSDSPWVTGAETAELALALGALGRRADAAALLRAMQQLRTDDGSYWTGIVYPDGAIWPQEQTSWTGAAVLLADALLRDDRATCGVFRATRIPAVAAAGDVCSDCSGATTRTFAGRRPLTESG